MSENEIGGPSEETVHTSEAAEPVDKAVPALGQSEIKNDTNEVTKKSDSFLGAFFNKAEESTVATMAKFAGDLGIGAAVAGTLAQEFTKYGASISPDQIHTALVVAGVAKAAEMTARSKVTQGFFNFLLKRPINGGRPVKE